MPTIDELPAAPSVSDTDELMVSQSDIARKATRGQLLAGVQPALAIAQGNLLGRVSAGTGSPEEISIGANLTLANSSLSAPPAFIIASQTIGGSPNPGDLVALAQGGQNAAISYSTFATGLGAIEGVNAGNFIASPTGVAELRHIADLFSDAISIECFGAAGDGQTDDTAAFNAALTSGRTVRLDSRVYAIAGSLVISQPAAMLGVSGLTVLRRTSAGSGGNWINLLATTFTASGVTFDAGSFAVTDAPAFNISNGCESATFSECIFLNAQGNTNGHGLLVTGTTNTTAILKDCRFSGNRCNGLDISGAGTVIVSGCTANGNGSTGISISSASDCTVIDTQSNGNQIGITVGNWQAASPVGLQPAPCILSRNICSDNAIWGLAASGAGAIVSGNSVGSNGSSSIGGGILCRMAFSRIAGNQVSGGAVGIDAQTCYGTIISDNQIQNTGTGLIAGACQNVLITHNFLLQNSWAICVPAFMPELSSTATGPISLTSNWIGFTGATGGGIEVLDGVQGASVTDNDLSGWGSATSSQALWLHTDSAVVRGNRWNNTAQFNLNSTVIAGESSLVVPDTADSVFVTGAPPTISSILTEHQVDTLGQITFLRVLQGGTGYTQAEAGITGAGTGASARAICTNGQVVGLVVANPGSGYGSIGAAANVVITGDGTGATAQAFVGLPVLAGRHLEIACSCPVRLTLAGSSPQQQSWTQYDLTVPAFGSVDLVGAFGGWVAVQSPPVDYLTPLGNGGAVLQSVSGGDVYLRPSSGGQLHIANGSEPMGCTSTVGRGAPTGTITAPPGSDFRNLNGGAGNTYWIKCTGTDSSGWVAVA